MNLNAQTNKTVLSKYLQLEQKGRWVEQMYHVFDLTKYFPEFRPATFGLMALGRVSGTRPRPWNPNLRV